MASGHNCSCSVVLQVSVFFGEKKDYPGCYWQPLCSFLVKDSQEDIASSARIKAFWTRDRGSPSVVVWVWMFILIFILKLKLVWPKFLVGLGKIHMGWSFEVWVMIRSVLRKPEIFNSADIDRRISAPLHLSDHSIASLVHSRPYDAPVCVLVSCPWQFLQTISRSITTSLHLREWSIGNDTNSGTKVLESLAT